MTTSTMLMSTTHTTQKRRASSHSSVRPAPEALYPSHPSALQTPGCPHSSGSAPSSSEATTLHRPPLVSLERSSLLTPLSPHSPNSSHSANSSTSNSTEPVTPVTPITTAASSPVPTHAPPSPQCSYSDLLDTASDYLMLEEEFINLIVASAAAQVKLEQDHHDEGPYSPWPKEWPVYWEGAGLGSW